MPGITWAMGCGSCTWIERGKRRWRATQFYGWAKVFRYERHVRGRLCGNDGTTHAGRRSKQVGLEALAVLGRTRSLKSRDHINRNLMRADKTEARCLHDTRLNVGYPSQPFPIAPKLAARALLRASLLLELFFQLPLSRSGVAGSKGLRLLTS